MTRSTPPRTRTAIVQDLKNGGKLAQIAREHGVSPSTVKKIRIEEGLQPLPTAEAKINAAQARDVNILKAQHLQSVTKMRLLDEIQTLLDSLHKPSMVYAFGRNADGAHAYVEHEIPEPDAKAKQATFISIGIAVQRMQDLERRESEGSSTAKAAIIDLFERMTADEAASQESA